MAVIDETQLLEDEQRGWAWTLAIAGVRAERVVLCGSEDGLLAAQRLARPHADSLAIFGTGTQARAHVATFARAFPLRSVRVVSRDEPAAFLRDVQQTCACEVYRCDAREALREAQLVVTATRATRPLFEGRLVAPGAVVCAVGSSRPDTRELDDGLIARAATMSTRNCVRSRWSTPKRSATARESWSPVIDFSLSSTCSGGMPSIGARAIAASACSRVAKPSSTTTSTSAWLERPRRVGGDHVEEIQLNRIGKVVGEPVRVAGDGIYGLKLPGAALPIPPVAEGPS